MLARQAPWSARELPCPQDQGRSTAGGEQSVLRAAAQPYASYDPMLQAKKWGSRERNCLSSGSTEGLRLASDPQQRPLGKLVRHRSELRAPVGFPSVSSSTTHLCFLLCPAGLTDSPPNCPANPTGSLRRSWGVASSSEVLQEWVDKNGF